MAINGQIGMLNKNHSDSAKQKIRIARTKEHIIVKCKNCSDDIEVTLNTLKLRNVSFCSNKCKSEYNTETRECLYCHNEFSFQRSRNRKFCSKSCAVKYNKNWKWRNNVSK